MSWVEKDVMVETLLKLRGTKGMTREKALDIIDQDANYFGTLMMYLHRADGMVSGTIPAAVRCFRCAKWPTLALVLMLHSRHAKTDTDMDETGCCRLRYGMTYTD
eukprot:3933651-Rhodomonas_salina.5